MLDESVSLSNKLPSTFQALRIQTTNANNAHAVTNNNNQPPSKYNGENSSEYSVESSKLQALARLNAPIIHEYGNSTTTISTAIESEASTFLLPEDQVESKLLPRIISPTVTRYVLKSGPLYLTTCYEEFSRRFITIEVAMNQEKDKDKPQQVLGYIDLEKVTTQDDPQTSSKQTHITKQIVAPQEVLQSYQPGYDYWLSTFRKHYPENKVHMLTPSYYDFSMLLKIHKCAIKQKPFEPIFGSVCFYAFINDEFHRVTESFYFDATQESVRRSFKRAYAPGGNTDTDFSYSVADVTGTHSHLNMFAMNLPKELRNGELYMVIQLSKILSSDPDKALLPYLSKGTLPSDQQKHRDACERLSHFRQPLGFSVSKLFDENGKLLIPWMGRNALPVYAQRVCLNDMLIGQVKTSFSFISYILIGYIL